MTRLSVFVACVAVVAVLGWNGSTETLAKESHSTVGEVRVEADGFYRISTADLASLNLGDIGQLRVTRRGVGVPYQIHDGGLVFLALSTAGPHSRIATFRVEKATSKDSNNEPAVIPAKQRKDETPSRDLLRVHAPDYIMGTLASAMTKVYDGDLPVWYAMAVEPQGEVTIDAASLGAAKGNEQRLSLKVYATYDGESTLSASWNDHDLGSVTVPTAAGGALFEWTVPGSVVPVDRATLTLRDMTKKLPRRHQDDVSSHYGYLWVDAIHLNGQVANVPDQLSNLSFARYPVQSGERVVAPQGVAFVLSRKTRSVPVPEWNKAWGGYNVGAVPTDAVLYAAKTIAPAKITKTLLRNGPLVPAGTQHLIVSVPDLVTAAGELAKHRSATGTPSRVVSLADIYARHGFGEHTPAALRAFLVAQMKRNDVPLKYVLLLGDAVFDRTDMSKTWTIPTPMARTMYNGATASDRLYTVPPGASLPTGGPSIGRLPFKTPAEVTTFVKRVKDYELHPPVSQTRRLMRFITSEGRFGPVADMMIESAFRNVIMNGIPPAYDIEVTFASVKSPFLWPPPQLNDKVISGINEGALFYTYVGHGFAKGFDSLRVGRERFPILNIADVPRIQVKSTNPIVFVLACTTAMFDQGGRRAGDGIGEALIKQPGGPIAYWGATRICHPAANTFIGRSMTRFMLRNPGSMRLGDVIRTAIDESMSPTVPDPGRFLIKLATRALAGNVDPDRLVREASAMYALLGDPATKIAFPKNDIEVSAARAKDLVTLEITAKTSLPDGTKMTLSVELPRTRNAIKPKPVRNVLNSENFETIRDNHRRMNDWAISRVVGEVKGGQVSARVTLSDAEGWEGLIVKAHAMTKTNVHQGAFVIQE